MFNHHVYTDDNRARFPDDNQFLSSTIYFRIFKNTPAIPSNSPTPFVKKVRPSRPTPTSYVKSGHGLTDGSSPPCTAHKFAPHILHQNGWRGEGEPKYFGILEVWHRRRSPTGPTFMWGREALGWLRKQTPLASLLCGDPSAH